MNNKGILYVISAPSGCGKGTILSEVMKSFKNIQSYIAEKNKYACVQFLTRGQEAKLQKGKQHQQNHRTR